VAIFTSALFEFTRASGVQLWTAGEQVPTGPGIRRLGYKRLGLFPILLVAGFKARIVDSFYFLVEYPNPVMVVLWVLLKSLLRFDWVKVVHDGSLPTRFGGFGRLRKMLFKLSVKTADEFVVVNDCLNRFLREEIGVTQKVTTVNPLLPIPDSEKQAALPPGIESAFAQYEMVVVSTGVFIPDYGFEHAALAVERLRRETGTDIALILIDGVFARDEVYRHTVLAGRDWITVLEKVPHAQVLEIFRRSKVFIRGFRYEAYGLSRIEAIWCGIPVIAAMGGENRGMLLYEFGELDLLTSHLRQALFSLSPQETERWADIFQHQAENNLERWRQILLGR